MTNVLIIASMLVSSLAYGTNLNKVSPPKAASFRVTADAGKHSALQAAFFIDDKDQITARIGALIAYDLEFTDQFSVTRFKQDEQFSKRGHKNMFEKGFSLAYHLQGFVHKNGSYDLTSILYDTSSDKELLNKTYHYEQQPALAEAHVLSGDILHVLTGDRGICQATLAFTAKDVHGKSSIYVSDYTTKLMQQIVTASDKQNIHVAPKWHSTQARLYYSRLNRFRSDLLLLDLQSKKKHVFCSQPGLNMQPSFSADGQKAVLCRAAGDLGVQLFGCDWNECQEKRQFVFKQITAHQGVTSSPSILPNGNLIFCSDFQTGSPQVYYLNMKQNAMCRLTDGKGFCAAPTYCETIRSIAYARRVNGALQLFTMPLQGPRKLQERQLTFDKGDKCEPCYTSCGNYLFFSYSPRGMASKEPSQIAVLSLRSGKSKVLTTGKSNKGYPAFTGHNWYSLARKV